jgi:two-component system, LytTR family, sensor kinase
MQNPLLVGKKRLLKYFAVWMAFALAFFVIMSIFLEANRLYLGVDIFLQNLIMAGLMIGIWYPVHYMSWENQSKAMLLINHLLVFSLFALAWLSLTNLGLRIVFNEPPLESYLAHALAFKILFCFFAYVVFVISTYLLKYYTSFIEKKETESRLMASIQEAELSLLRHQMNPHFIFNSLNSISSLTLIDSEKAHEMVVKLSDFLRYTVGYGQMKMVPLEKELEMCRAYLDIERIRFGEKIDLKIEVQAQALPIEMPSMLLQTLFENAIKHGIYNSLEPGQIVFKASLESNRLVIDLQNSFDPHPSPKIGTQTGLKNIKERLKLVYQNLAIFSVESLNNRFIVKISLPAKS